MTDVDWFVTIVALGLASAGAGWYGYRRWRHLVLSPADLEFAVVDPLSAAAFTRYCAALLRLLGYQRVRRARGGAVSLTAAAPDGELVVIRCARQKEQVGADAVRALHEATTTGGHAGRAGVLVTNALVTPQARKMADDAGITVADRAVLRHWMELARGSATSGNATSGSATSGSRSASGTSRVADTRVLVATMGCAGLLIAAVAVHAAVSTPSPRAAAATTSGVPGNATASIATAPATATGTGTPAAGTPGAGDPAGGSGNPAGTAGSTSGGGLTGRERHLLHVKHVEHVEHMSHVEFAEHHEPGQQG